MMVSSGRNLVLGTAWDIGIPDVRIFVESLRRHYDGDVMLLVRSQGNPALINYLRSHRVIPVYFDCQLWMVVHVQLGRYVRYEEMLRAMDREYDRILLTDVSDVVFQADPFAQVPDGELVCFLEAQGRAIAQCFWNSKWVQDIFGPAGLELVKNFDISCAGTTIGSHRAIVRYIDLILANANLGVMSKLQQLRGHDQGIHNYLLRTGALPMARLIPNGQHVHTIAYVPDSDVTLGPAGTLLSPGGRLCPIVHQYNYKPYVLAHLRAAYGLSADGR